MFSPAPVSLLEAETDDTSQAVYISLWALFVPNSVKGANLLPVDSPLQNPFPHTELASR